MDKPIKDWGFGIPKYTEKDLLKGLELHEFCTNMVARSMQDDGFTIEGVIVNNTPTQIIANKKGKRYFVIVAGGIYPNEGKIPFSMKRKFSKFCANQNVVPMFASVGLMSTDKERAEAGLALKFDGYYVKYTGNEDLSIVKEPTPDSGDYEAYCMEQIIEAYSTGRFGQIYDFFDDGMQYRSQWVRRPLFGKKAVCEYFDGKGKAIQSSDTGLKGSVVIENSDKTQSIFAEPEPSSPHVLISQQIKGETNWIYIIPKFNENHKLIELSLQDSGDKSFSPYYAFE